MKKEDIAAAVKKLRLCLNSDKIVTGSDQCIENRFFEACEAYRSSIVGLVVSGKGHYDRLSSLELNVAAQLNLDSIYDDKINTFWVPHWSSLPTFANGQQVHFIEKLKTFESRTFIEAHRRVICLDTILEVNLRTSHPEGEFIAEVVTDGADPTIQDVETTLRLIRELAKVFCEAFYPGELDNLRVTYLDMGSNYQVGVKIDSKAEIGSNLAKFLTQILKFVTNPRAFIHASRVETLRQKVEAFADLQKRVVAGEISHEAGELLASELFGAAKKLTTHGVFPASLLKEREETNTVQEFRSLITESSFQTALPEPKFELPQKSESGEAVG